MTAPTPRTSDTAAEPLLAALRRHAQTRGDRDAVRFLARGEAVTDRLTYADMMTAVDETAAGLIVEGAAGRPVVLALGPGTRFVVTFLACLRAGAIAVTVPYPAVAANRERFVAVVADCRPFAVVCEAADEDLPGLPEGTRRLVAGALRRPVGALPPEPGADALALVQYSSGSTRAPRGVVITHGNIAAAERMIQAAMRADEDNVTVSWLPPFHDMGLIGSILHPLYVGGVSVLMPPNAFLQKPMRWLRTISEHRATIAGGPNFGFDLCVRRAPADGGDGGLDLSSWKVAFCGSEPVRAATLSAFADRFAGVGFDPSALMPCYGLAEATLLVSARLYGTGVAEFATVGTDTGAPPLSRVSCGVTPPGCSVRLRPIEGAAAEAVGAPEIGEVCIGGAHIALGTWAGADQAVVPFEAAFTSADGLRLLPTGDVGALSGGELAIIDRIKDIVAVYGRKLHAVDVEDTVLSEPGTEVVAAAAFAVPVDGRESLALLCEIRTRDLAALDRTARMAQLRDRVAQAHGVVPVVGLLTHGALPRTSSGKIQRQRTRALFLGGELRIAATTTAGAAA
ncbi:AMP-binding protein [Pseudoxanthobacter sp. M-2]|uniref:AMP-binding protein n=1 Tax=Pseudoxanthobacter sp. M-2 TaxID=3078754 RepID=UPI0038FC9984